MHRSTSRVMPVAIALAGVGLALAACTKSRRASNDGPTDMPTSSTPAAASDKRAVIHLTGGSGEVQVSAEVVASAAAVERGLMYRQHMPPDDGMLFLMGDDDDHTFWMRNTLIPLDMIFIGKEMKVVGVVERAEPRTDTRRSVGAVSRYVLEVNGGWAAAHGIGAGATVRWEGVERIAR